MWTLSSLLVSNVLMISLTYIYNNALVRTTAHHCTNYSLAMVTRTAIVTGAAQGIGEAISLRLSDEDIDVALLDISAKERQLQELAKQIEAKGRRALVILADVTLEDEVQTAFKKTIEVLGGIDIVSSRGFCLLGIKPKFIHIRWLPTQASCCVGHFSRVSKCR